MYPPEKKSEMQEERPHVGAPGAKKMKRKKELRKMRLEEEDETGGGALHRFEVSQKPNMRIIQNYEAMIGTAVTVARGRSGELEAKSANDWLSDQTAETAIQTAMMGDAGDETLQLVRFFDA